MWGWLFVGLAWATSGSLEARLAEVEPLRTMRLIEETPDIPAEAYAQVAQGKTPTGIEDVEGFAAKKSWGIAIVDVSIGEYWAAINDDPGKERTGVLQHVKVLEGGACAPERKVFQYLGVSLASDRWWVADINVNHALQERTEGRVREMTWQTIDYDFSADPEVTGWAADGMALAFSKGAWFLVDLGGGRTLVEYYGWTDPGGRIPAGLASRFAAGNISDTLHHMADTARTGTACPVQ